MLPKSGPAPVFVLFAFAGFYFGAALNQREPTAFSVERIIWPGAASPRIGAVASGIIKGCEGAVFHDATAEKIMGTV
jgi:hypothetical protein